MEKFKSRQLFFIGVVVVLTMFMTITSFADWQKNEHVWKYDYNGNYLIGMWDINGKRYYFDQNANMVTGWRVINGNWYYFNADGPMAFNQWIGDYYVGNNGAMLTSTWIGPYYVGEDGKWNHQNSIGGQKQNNCIANLRNSYNDYFICDIQGIEDTEDSYKVKCTVAKAVTVPPSFESSSKIGEKVRIGKYNYTVVQVNYGNGINYIRENDGIACYLIQNVCPNGNAAMRFMGLDNGEGWLFDGYGTEGDVYIAKNAEINLIDKYDDFQLLGNISISAEQYVNGNWDRERFYSLAECPGWIETDGNGIIQRLTVFFDD